jgi:hypothetical protein
VVTKRAYAAREQTSALSRNRQSVNGKRAGSVSCSPPGIHVPPVAREEGHVTLPKPEVIRLPRSA